MSERIQYHLSETLHGCLGKREKKALKEFEEKKFAKIKVLNNEEILDKY